MLFTPPGESYPSVYLNLPSPLSLSFFFGALQVFLKEALEQRLEKEREEVRTAAGMVIRAHILSYVARLVQLCVCLCINTLCWMKLGGLAKPVVVTSFTFYWLEWMDCNNRICEWDGSLHCRMIYQGWISELRAMQSGLDSLWKCREKTSRGFQETPHTQAEFIYMLFFINQDFFCQFWGVVSNFVFQKWFF